MDAESTDQKFLRIMHSNHSVDDMFRLYRIIYRAITLEDE